MSTRTILPTSTSGRLGTLEARAENDLYLRIAALSGGSRECSRRSTGRNDAIGRRALAQLYTIFTDARERRAEGDGASPEKMSPGTFLV